LNQNWIVENLNNAFSTWNGKLTELWGLVTTSPQTFKGGAVWGVMQSLHNAMIGIGYALIVLFFAISLFKNTANFHELKRPEAAVPLKDWGLVVTSPQSSVNFPFQVEKALFRFSTIQF
jgi:hypothetical protein